jgi:hypothetical protein
VIRFDYTRRDGIAVRLREALRTPPGARGAAISAAAALAAIAIAAAVQVAAHVELDGRLEQLQARAAALEPAARRAAELRAVVDRLQALNAARAAARGTSLASLDLIASIGNRWPAGAWLTRVQAAGDAWTFEGRALGVAPVAEALHTLSTLDGSARVRLVSLAAVGAETRAVRFTIGWERRR